MSSWLLSASWGSVGAAWHGFGEVGLSSVGWGFVGPIVKVLVRLGVQLLLIGTWLYLATAPCLAGDCVLVGTGTW